MAAPVTLRLVYHDAGTFSKKAGDGGLNASIRRAAPLHAIGFELDRPENFGLKRGWNLIEQAKASLKGTPAEGLVSYSDLIAWAGARAVLITGGPAIPLTIGRADAGAADPPGRMASERSDAAALVDNFADKGFDVRELVALSGAHTIGGKGFGDAATFDNAYYTALLAKPWLDKTNPMWDHIGLPSDHALPEDPRCLGVINEYASDEAAFKRDFAAAYRKLCATGAAWRAV
ncbi:MAG: heme peroxidase [Monoraphidium minutum]|nr:MAG: heme peroxidase [Monoraphidium minutum]